MNLLKMLTRAGRQQLVADAAKDYLKPETVAALVADAVAKALEAGADKLGDERCAQIANGCQHGGNALIHLTAAVAPDGEDGRKVSAAEKALIASDIRSALGELLTQPAIDAVIDRGVAYVP